jgi:hypothetical protein
MTKNFNNNNNYTSRTTWASKRVTFADTKEEGFINSISPRKNSLPTTLSTTPSYQQLRDDQVKKMIAGQRFNASVTTPWPEPSPSMLKRWSERHQAFKTYSTNYMASQRRTLFLADLEPHLRFEAFEKVCFQRCLAPTTAETYWTTWLSIQKAMCLFVSESDPRVTKILKARSVAYPVQFPTPAKLSDMKLLVATFAHEWPSLTAIATMTFIYGQRISDMIQLAACDLEVQRHFLVITVRRGKTFTTAKPYALWLRRHRYPTEELIDVAHRAKKLNRIFLFSESNTDQERSKVLDAIREMIVCVNDELELRSLRRGGLHLMAENGQPLSSIIKFSRHADIDMLMRYLNWGTVSTNHRDEMISAVDKSCEQIESVIQEMNQPTTSLQGCSRKFTQSKFTM